MSELAPRTDQSTLTADLLAWRAGCQRAANRFAAKIRARMERFVRGKGWHRSGLDFEELFHDAFVAFLAGVHAFEVAKGDGGIVAWFKTTLKRRIWGDAASRRREVALESAPEPSTDDNRETERLLKARLAELREVTQERRRVSLHRKTKAQFVELLDHVESVLDGRAEPAQSQEALASLVGWSNCKLSKLANRFSRAMAGEAAPSRQSAQPRVVHPRSKSVPAHGTVDNAQSVPGPKPDDASPTVVRQSRTDRAHTQWPGVALSSTRLAKRSTARLASAKRHTERRGEPLTERRRAALRLRKVRSGSGVAGREGPPDPRLRHRWAPLSRPPKRQLE